MHGFGFAEMPPVIFGGKGEARHRPLKAGGVNNRWSINYQQIIGGGVVSPDPGSRNIHHAVCDRLIDVIVLAACR
ncbi:MAG: hypothetical protein PUB00_09695 [Clostridiales bacterium]|nr:hypothetical protein [Clostridiales bacterium]